MWLCASTDREDNPSWSDQEGGRRRELYWRERTLFWLLPPNGFLVTLTVWLGILVWSPAPVRAFQNKPAADVVIVEEQAETEPDAALKKRKDRDLVIFAAGMAIFGIAVLGGVLLLWLLWWGRRTRQMIRATVKPTPREDELWYLKNKPPPGNPKLPPPP